MEYKPTVGAWVTNYDIPWGCHLYIVDASGSSECTSLVQQYLRHLDCVIFVFALDEPASLIGLGQWVATFEREFAGNAASVKKFVVGTKMDAGYKESAQLQKDASSLAEQINAEFWITSAKTSANVNELFMRVGDTLIGQTPCVQEPTVTFDHDRSCRDSERNALILNDILMSWGTLLRYPDPVAMDTGKSVITNITVNHQSLVMFGEEKEFTWGTNIDGR